MQTALVVAFSGLAALFLVLSAVTANVPSKATIVGAVAFALIAGAGGGYLAASASRRS